MMLNSDDYNKISLDIYKEIYSEAKEKYIEYINQSEMITGRGSRIIFVLIAIATWAAASIGNLLKENSVVAFFYIVILFSAITFCTILLFPKRIPFRGTMPRVIYKDAADLLNEKYEQEKVFFFQQINRYQKKIDNLSTSNNRRVAYYKLALALTFILFLLTTYLFVKVSTNS